MKRHLIASLACGLMAMAGIAQAQTFGPSALTHLTMTVAPEAALSISGDTALTNTAGTFGSPFIGTTTFLYKIRTGGSAGTAAITMAVTDFSGAGTIAMSANELSYACGGGGIGTKCTGTPNATNTAATVIGFGANVHSVVGGDTGTVAWTLINDPAYAVGSYTASVTFTISAT